MIAIRIGKLAEALGVHRNSIRNWIKSGKLRARPTVGRKYLVDAEELNRFLRSKGIDPELAGDLVDKAQKAKTPAAGLAAPAVQTGPLPPDQTYGSVMVVGGGISAIQASLDLAETGYFVYMVEKSPGIGGGMARLDKTFPTNDCAM